MGFGPCSPPRRGRHDGRKVMTAHTASAFREWKEKKGGSFIFFFLPLLFTQSGSPAAFFFFFVNLPQASVICKEGIIIEKILV